MVCADSPNRMLKKSASIVLASLRGSTLKSVSEVGSTGGAYPFAKTHSRATAHTKCGMYLLASSLAAALLDGLFQHPAR